MSKLLLIPAAAFCILWGLNSPVAYGWENPVAPKRQTFYNNDGSVYTGPNKMQYNRVKVREYDRKTKRTSRSTCRSWGNSTVRCIKF